MEQVRLIRSRLLARLEETGQHRLTVLSTPAGYGKTTLLEQWQPARALSLSLTEADRDPGVFKRHFLGVLEARYPQATAQAAEQMPEHLAAELLNALVRCSSEITVIFDGYEHIDHQALVKQAVEYAPPTLHLVIATRSRPQLPLGRLRARGLLLELGITDLAFTLEETVAYLTDACGATPEASTALHKCTTGWAVGLRRAATLMADGLSSAEVVRHLKSDPTLTRYLDAVAFAAEPAPVREALLAGAREGTLDATACDAAVLERLEAGHLYITPQNGGMCYRLQPLYAAFLRRRDTPYRQGSHSALYEL